jgi:hypothetical protein
LANGKHFDLLFNPTPWEADKHLVGRLFGYVFMLAALAVGGYLVLKAAQDAGPTSANQQQLEDSANQVSASINLQQATPVMEAWFSTTGTYVGAQSQLPPSFGVTLVRADKFTYCLQAGSSANVQHMNGPNENAPVAGAC